jgi:hypothetical protein
MIEFTVDVQHESEIISMLAGVRSQTPYAISVSINRSLDDAQAAIRRTLPEHFHLRSKEFVERTIYIANKDRARKDNLVGIVRVNPERNFLAKFETDHEKRARGGKNLAVPVLRIRQPDLIIKRSHPLSFKKVMQAIDQRGGRIKARRKKGAPPPGPLGDVFLLKKNGRTLVMQRPVSGGDRTGNRSNLKVLYVFEHEVPIEPELHFADTALATAQRVWVRNFEAAIDHAIRTAR